jgi:hypothetical protein
MGMWNGSSVQGGGGKIPHPVFFGQQPGWCGSAFWSSGTVGPPKRLSLQFRQNGKPPDRAVLPDSQIPEELLREERGRQVFANLLKAWLTRSGWSYAVFADLAEEAVKQLEAVGIRTRGSKTHEYKKGEIRIFNGHVWRAKRDGCAPLPRLRESEQSDWQHLATTRRVAASQVNNYVLNRVTHAHVQMFDTCGLLNQYIDAFQKGKCQGPVDSELRKRALEGIVIEDEQGVFAAEEFFSVYVGNMKMPAMLESMTDKEAIELSATVAREIRNVITACGLDLIEDWPQFISAYPSTDTARHAKIRDVVLGQGRWSAEQVRDEQAAVAIALQRLRTRHGVGPNQVPQLPPQLHDRRQNN